MVNGKALAMVKKSKQVENAKGKKAKWQKGKTAKRQKGKKAKGQKNQRAKSRRYVLAAGGQPPMEGHCLIDLSAPRTTWIGLINSNL